MQPENILTVDGLDFELYFATEILKLKSLHYGYWQKGQSLNLENIKLAQEEYTKTLMTLIPSEVRSVLDVGSGIGDNAKAMANMGLSVTAISPDKNHSQFYENSPEIKFFNQKFEDFKIENKFDLVLMSESHNYFKTDVALEKITKLINENGHLLVSGIFNMSKDKTLEDVFYSEQDYIDIAKKNGFELINRIDITENVLPTLEIMDKAWKEYFIPTKKVLSDYLNYSAGLKWKIIKFLFGKQLKQLGKWEKFYQTRSSPEIFNNNGRYLRLLFKKS